MSESERDEARDSGRGDNGADADGEVIAAVPAAKKRRIAPTLISGEDTPTDAPAPPTSAEK